MKKVLVIVLALASTSAFADGFVCQTRNNSLTVKAYNNTDASEGTRTAAIMVISDPEVKDGNKTIARFTETKGTVTSSSESYTANVDLRESDSNKAGRLIGGTKLGQLDTIVLDVDFSYAQPVENGAEIDGVLHLNKRGGGEIALDVECERYLKN